MAVTALKYDAKKANAVVIDVTNIDLAVWSNVFVTKNKIFVEVSVAERSADLFHSRNASFHSLM